MSGQYETTYTARAPATAPINSQVPQSKIASGFTFCRKARRLAFHKPNKKPHATKIPYQVIVSGPNSKAMSCTAHKLEPPRPKSKVGLRGIQTSQRKKAHIPERVPFGMWA